MSTIEALIDISLCFSLYSVSVSIFFSHDYTLSYVSTKLLPGFWVPFSF